MVEAEDDGAEVNGLFPLDEEAGGDAVKTPIAALEESSATEFRKHLRGAVGRDADAAGDDRSWKGLAFDEFGENAPTFHGADCRDDGFEIERGGGGRSFRASSHDNCDDGRAN